MSQYLGTRSRVKGLTTMEIEAIANIDWDLSSDEDEDSAGELEFAEKEIRTILERGEEMEAAILENLVEDDANTSGTDEKDKSAKLHFEKVDVSKLKLRKREMQAFDVEWKACPENDNQCEQKTPTEYFELFFDDKVFEIGKIKKKFIAQTKLDFENKSMLNKIVSKH